MGFLTPLALVLATLCIPILVFYMLKLRRDERVISSTMLWRQVLQDREANSPWQRLHRNLLLLLQLLLLFLLVLALARPYSEIERAFQGNVIVLLDASASMQAIDVSPSRFEVARERTRQIIDGLGPNDTLTLIAVADTPRVLASLTNDKSVLRQALATAQVNSTEADWSAAFILAASSAQKAARNIFVIISDGGCGLGDCLDDATGASLPLLPGQVNYVPVGVSAENCAISALAIRDRAGSAGPQAYVRVAHWGAQPANVLVEVHVNGALFDARTLALKPDSESGFALADLPLDASQIEARLSADAGQPQDAQALDDRAWAVRAPGRQAAAMLVTPGNTFLERALALMPNLNLLTVRVTETLTNAQITMPATPPTWVILDGIQPFTVPPSNLLFIAPPASTGLFDVNGIITQTKIVNAKTDASLLRYVDLANVHVARAQAVSTPSWATSLIEAEGGPLLLAGEVGGRRVAILTFDLHQSDLPLQIAFPILIANLTSWLAPTSSIDAPGSETAAAISPGMPVQIRPEMGVDEIVVVTPSGQRHVLPLQDAEPVSFALTGELGIYTVEQKRQDQVLRSEFAVNLFSEMESRIAPQDKIQVGQAEVSGQARGEVGRREWWRWPALAALGILLVEWMVYLRGRGSFKQRPHGQVHARGR